MAYQLQRRIIGSERGPKALGIIGNVRSGMGCPCPTGDFDMSGLSLLAIIGAGVALAFYLAPSQPSTKLYKVKTRSGYRYGAKHEVDAWRKMGEL